MINSNWVILFTMYTFIITFVIRSKETYKCDIFVFFKNRCVCRNMFKLSEVAFNTHI